MVIAAGSDTALPLSSSSPVVLSLLSVDAEVEMKKVVGDNATLPCHHHVPTSELLDIEWLLQKPNSKQKMVRRDVCLTVPWSPQPHLPPPVPSLDYQGFKLKTIPLKLEFHPVLAAMPL